MESTLHRQLKEHYATSGGQLEAQVAGFRIDVVAGDVLIEIQHGSLAAIRDKVQRLTRQHRVLVVKPIVVRKRIVRRDRRGGSVVGERWSPKTGRPVDLFDELVFFTRAFPNPNLVLEAALIDVEEWRYPGHGKRRRWRERDHVVEDQFLVSVHETLRFQSATDLLNLVPEDLGEPFDTAMLAKSLELKRWVAQRVAYCLRQTGAVKEVGKSGNSRLYRRAAA